MRLLAAFAAILLTSGCATTGPGTTDMRDPWEKMNRGIYEFNDSADIAIVQPLARGYNRLPGWTREGVGNFFGNLDDVATGFNNFLQGKPVEGVSDLGRVVVNSVLGVFGLWDVATPMGLEKHNEDFGQTLAVWGVNSGPYLVIPFLGPSTLRDAPARLVDPGWYLGYKLDNSTLSWSLWSVNELQIRASLLRAESVLETAAIDKYAFIRDAWLQRRRSLVYDGNPPRIKEED
jgi:phospholipid-binding lipoprotein MlaA